VHVRREPDQVGDALALDEAKQLGDLELATERLAIAVRDCLVAGLASGVLAIRDD
jgi:hypothetical protein